MHCVCVNLGFFYNKKINRFTIKGVRWHLKKKMLGDIIGIELKHAKNISKNIL